MYTRVCVYVNKSLFLEGRKASFARPVAPAVQQAPHGLWPSAVLFVAALQQPPTALPSPSFLLFVALLPVGEQS